MVSLKMRAYKKLFNLIEQALVFGAKLLVSVVSQSRENVLLKKKIKGSSCIIGRCCV